MESTKTISRKEGVALTPAQDKFLLSSFLLLIVGKPGSGKSYTCRELVMSDKYYKGKFDCVFVVSPSIQKLGIKTKKEYTNSSYDLPWIFNQFALINQN